MDKLYALLVGIDAYQPPLRALTGCLNDVAAMEEFLTKRLKPNQLALKILRDKEATRQGIIDTFRSHLGQARPGDTALFYYAGHGSRELTPDLYRHLEPDGRDETLVAYDSRLPGGWDLADKEMSVLVAEVAKSGPQSGPQNGPHVVVILDSCHSGGATRLAEDLPVRRAQETAPVPRPAETFWFFSEDRKPPKELDSAGGWKILPRGKHVLLSACHDFQTAREYDDPKRGRRGAFSYFLVQALEQLGGDVRYLDLHKRVQALVAHSVNDQVPQAEGDLEGSLFGGALPARPQVFHVQNWGDRGWRLDAGQVHAIQPGTELVVLREGAAGESGARSRLPTVVVSQVEAAESAIEVKKGKLPDRAGALPAIVSRLPFPLLTVTLKGESLPEELRRWIAGSAYLEVRDDAESGVVVEAVPEGIRLTRQGSPRDLAHIYPAESWAAGKVRVALEKIARWEAISKLANPSDPFAGALRMTVFEWKGAPPKPGADPVTAPLPEKGEIRLRYKGKKEGRFTVRIENRGSRDLYFALLGLDEAFGIKRIEDAWGRLLAGNTIWVREVDGIPAAVPDRYYNKGVTQRRDVLLLLVSEQEADFGLLEQTSLSAEDVAWRSGEFDVMDLLVWQPGYREVDEGPRGAASRWSAQAQVIVAQRSTAEVEVEDGRGDAELAPGVRLVTPDGFRGTARLLNTAEAAERLGELLDPPPVAGVDTYPLALAGGWGSDGGLSVLELTGGDVSTVTAKDPLKVFADPHLPDGEVPVVLAFDGRRHWRVGAPGAAGFPLEIPQLPQPVDGSVWLLFRSARRESLEFPDKQETLHLLVA
ncbi:MAG TPA: caspase family protein [Thermoanaerobaculia bacterium]|jgi:hypothetical protein|nr:caspase family protein [Thermoanaerobaculia bacterium]